LDSAGTNTWRVITGDVRQSLRSLPEASVQTCVTSPPYWGLRDYGMPGQLGLEPTPDAYVAAMVDVFDEVWRVLKEDGTLWLNLGDSYASDTKGSGGPCVLAGAGNAMTEARYTKPRKVDHGLKQKDLVGIPWRVAFALQADGWYLRSDIIWSKPNPMPESVTDRPTKAHEYLFLMSKSERYFYDAAAITEASTIGAGAVRRVGADVTGRTDRKDEGRHTVNDGTRNKRTVWAVATQPYPEAHFATFPEALIEPCILAGSRIGDTVLDPFNGSGTTGAVSIRHQRNYIGVELNPAYVELARTRIGAVSPLFAVEAG
jgi:DNA modification methylase